MHTYLIFYGSETISIGQKDSKDRLITNFAAVYVCQVTFSFFLVEPDAGMAEMRALVTSIRF